MGLGDRLPFEAARHVVPRLPRSRQRFAPSTSWEAACAESVGYGASIPSAPVVGTANAAPLAGNELATVAAFGVALSRVGLAARPVTVVDFGGFDGRYAELIQAAYPDAAFQWLVVELPAVVTAVGSRSREGLRFTDDLDAALREPVDITFASASINYVPQPMQLLDQLLAASTVGIVARLPLWPLPGHRVAVQRAQRGSHEISYPTWFFSERAFLEQVSHVADCLLDFVCPDDRAAFAGHYARYRGLVLAARTGTGGRAT